MKVYIVDYLGIHCGMHYYNEAFRKVLLSAVPEAEVRILSNYSPENRQKHFFCNQYKGAKWRKLCSLLLNYLRLWWFVITHKNSCFIYLTYGNRIDLPFMRIIAMAKRYLIDIHEAIAQNVDQKQSLKSRFRKLYAQRISGVIVHSQRTDDFLDEYGYTGIRLHVPHFRYCFQQEYNLRKVGQDVQKSIVPNKINILFFGNINRSKGVDILISAVNKLPDQVTEKLNVVIAGKDFDGAIREITPKNTSLFHVILRHIEDDELIFLYGHTDYVALPYRKTSQSGILEMAFYFQKPIIANDVPYFRTVLAEFPSFGVLSTGIEDPETYAQALFSVINSHGDASFFNSIDYAHYTHREEIGKFEHLFADWIKKKAR